MEHDDCCCEIKPWCCTDFQSVMKLGIDQPSLASTENLRRSILSMLRPANVYASEAMSVDAPVRVDDVDHHVRVRSELIIPTHTIITSQPELVGEKPPKPRRGVRETSGDTKKCRDPKEKTLEEEEDDDDDDDDDDIDDEGDGEEDDDDDENADEEDDDDEEEEDEEDNEECEDEDKDCEDDEIAEEEEGEDDDIINTCRDMKRFVPCRDVAGRNTLYQAVPYIGRCVAAEDVGGKGAGDCEQVTPKICDEKSTAESTELGTNKEPACENAELNELHEECMYIDKEELKAICKKYRRYDKKFRDKKSKTPASDGASPNKKTEKTKECDKSEDIECVEDKKDECPNPCSAGDDDGDEEDEDLEEVGEEEEDVELYFGAEKPGRIDPCLDQVTQKVTAEPVSEIESRDYSRYDNKKATCGAENSSEENSYFSDKAKPFQTSQQKPEQKISQPVPAIDAKHKRSRPELVYYDDQKDKKNKQQKKSKEKEVETAAVPVLATEVEESNYFDSKIVHENKAEKDKIVENKAEKGKIANNLVAEMEKPKVCPNVYYISSLNSNNNNVLLSDGTQDNSENKDDVIDSDDDNNRGVSRYSFRKESEVSSDKRKSNYSSGMMEETCGHVASENVQYSEDGDYKVRSYRVDGGAGSEIASPSSAHCTPAAAATENQSKYWAYGQSSEDEGGDGYFASGVSTSEFAEVAVTHSVKNRSFDKRRVPEPGPRVTKAESKIIEGGPTVLEQGLNAADSDPMYADYFDEKSPGSFTDSLRIDTAPTDLMIATLTSNRYEDCKRIFKSMRKRAFGEDFEDNFENCDDDDLSDSLHRSLSGSSLSGKGPTLTSGSETAISGTTAEDNGSKSGFLSNLFSMISKSGTMLHQHIGKRYSGSGKDDSEKDGKYFSIGRYRQKANQKSPENQGRRELYSKPGIANFKFGKELNEGVSGTSYSEAYTEGIPLMARPTPHRWKQAKLDNKRREHNFRFGQLLSNESSAGLHRAPCAHRHASFAYKSTSKFNDRESFIGGFSFNPYQNESDDVMSRHSQNSFNKFRIFGTANQTVFEEKLESGCQKNETEEGKLNGGDTSDGMQVKNNLINCITAIVGNQLEPQIEQQAGQVSEVTESVALSSHVSLNKTENINSSEDLDIKLAEILPFPTVTGKLSTAATAADTGEAISSLHDSRNSDTPADLAACRQQHVMEAGDAQKEFVTPITVTPDPPSQRDVQANEIPDSNKLPTLETAAVAADENTTIRTTNITSACDHDGNTNDNRRIRIAGSVELLTDTVAQTVVITRESRAADNSQQSPSSISTILGSQNTSCNGERNVDTAHVDTRDLVQKQCLQHVVMPDPNESVVASEDHCVVPGRSRHKFYRSQKSGTSTGVCSVYSFKSKNSSSGTGSKSPLRSRNQQSSILSKIKTGWTKKPCYHTTSANNCRASHAALKKWKMVNIVSSSYREENQNVNCLDTGEVPPNSSLGNVDSISFDAESQSADNAAAGKDHSACGEDKAASPRVVDALFPEASREPRFAPKLVNYSEHDLMNDVNDCAKQLNESLSQDPAPYIEHHYLEVSKNLPPKIQILMGEVSRNQASLGMSSQKGVVTGVQLVNNNIIQLSEGEGVNGDAPLEQEDHSGMSQCSSQTSLLQQLQDDIINKNSEGSYEVGFNDYKPIMVSNYINKRDGQRLSPRLGKNSDVMWKHSSRGSSDKCLAAEEKGMIENCNADTNKAESEKTLIRSQNQDEVYPGGQICSQSEHNDRGMLFLNSHYTRYQDYNVSRSDEAGNETVDTSYVESFIDKRNKRKMSAELTDEDAPVISSEALSAEDMAEESCWSVRSFSPVATSWNVSDDGQDKVTAYWRGTGACGETICKGSRTEPYRFRERFTEWSNRTDICVDSGQHGKEWFTNDHESDRATAGQAQVQQPATNSSSTELKRTYSELEQEKESAGSHGAQKEEELKQKPQVRSRRPIKVNTFIEKVQESCYKKFASQETESDNFGDNAYETESTDNEWYTGRSSESDRYVPQLVMVPTFLPADVSLKDETVINRPDDQEKEAAPAIARKSWRSPRLITEHDQSMFGGNEKIELPANKESPENEPIKEDRRDRRCKMKEPQLASCTFPSQSSDLFAQQRLVNGTRSGAEMKEMQLEQSFKKHHTNSRPKSQSPAKPSKMPEIDLSDTSCPDMGLKSELKLWSNTERSEIGQSTTQAWGNCRHKEDKERKSVCHPYRYIETKKANPVTGRLPSSALRGKAPEIPIPVKNQTKTEKDEKIQANETSKETKPQARVTNSTKEIKTENAKKEKPSRIYKIDYEESKKKNGRINGPVSKTSSNNKQKSSQADANKPTQNETLKNINVPPQQTNSSGYPKHEAEVRNISENSRKSKPIRMPKIDINDTLRDRHKANINNLEHVQKAEQNTILSDVIQALHNAFTGKEDNKDGEFKPETTHSTEGPKKQKPARVFKLELEEKVKGKNRRNGQTTHYKQKTSEAETKPPDQEEVSQSNMDSSRSTANNTANVERNKPKMAQDIQRYKQKQSDIKISGNPKEKVENSSTEKSAEICSNQEVAERTDSPSADRKKEVKYPVLYREERKRWKEVVKIKGLKADSEKIKTSDSTSNQHSKDANQIQIHPTEEGRYQGLVKAADVQGPAKPSNTQGLVKPHNAHGLVKSSIAQGTVRPNIDQGLAKPNTAQSLARASNTQASTDNHKSKQPQDVNRPDRSQSAKAKRNTVPSSHADNRVEDKIAKTRSKGNEARGSSRVTESKTAPNLSKQYSRHTDIIAPNIMDNSLVDTVARAWIEDSGKMGGNRTMSPRALIHETSASQSVSCSYMAGPTILARPRKRQPSTEETEPRHSSGDALPYRNYPQAPKYHEDYSVHSQQSGNKIPDSYFDTSDINYEGKTYSSTYTGEEQFDQIQENQREMNDEYVSEIRPFYHVLDRLPPDDANVSSRPYYKYNERYRTGGEKRHASLEDSLIKQEPCFNLKSDVNNLQKNDTNMGPHPTTTKAKQKHAPETVNKWRAHDKPEKRSHDKSLHRSQAKSKHDPHKKAQDTKEKSGTAANSGNSEGKGRLFSYKMTTQGNRSETTQNRSKTSQSQAVPSVISHAPGKPDNTRIHPGKALLSEHGHEILIPTTIETSDRERNEVAQGAPAQGLFTRIFNTLVGPSRTKAPVKEQDVSTTEQNLPTVVPENVSSFTDGEKDASKHQSKPARSCPTLSMTEAKRLRNDYKKNMNCNAGSHDWNQASDTATIKLDTQQEQKWLQEMCTISSGNEAELPDYLTQNVIELPQKKPKRISDDAEISSPLLETIQKQHIQDTVQWNINKEMSPKKTINFVWAFAKCIVILFIVSFPLYVATFRTGLNHSIPIWQPSSRESFYGTVYLALVVVLINKYLQTRNWTFYNLLLLCANKREPSELCSNRRYLDECLVAAFAIYIAYSFQYRLMNIFGFLCFLIVLSKLRSVLVCSCCGGYTFQLTKPLSPGTDEAENEAPCPSGNN